MSAPSAIDSLRRGWCPGTLRPMETGDGWLVRLHPPGARLSPVQLRRVAGLAREHGNGLVEISARANLQIRGVTADSHPTLVQALLADGLVDERGGDGPQRLTLVSPLAGTIALPPPACGGEDRGGGQFRSAPTTADEALLSVPPPRPSPPQAGGESSVALIDAVALADAIEAAARDLHGLPAKLGIVVDDGGPLPLDAFPADIRLRATAPGEIRLGLPSGLWFGPVSRGDAPAKVARLLSGFLAHHRRQPGEVRRFRDLSRDALVGLAAAAGLSEAAPPPQRAAARRVGAFDWSAGRRAVVIGLPFGRCEARTLDALAAACGADAEIRFSPWRGIAFRGPTDAAAEALLALADDLGLVTRDDDPRLSVQACAGSPACKSAQAPTMADAARLAGVVPGLLAAGLRLHVSGCIKGCAHPGPTDLTLVADAGRYRVVEGGAARDSASEVLDLSAIMARLQPGRGLHARLSAAARKETGV